VRLWDGNLRPAHKREHPAGGGLRPTGRCSTLVGMSGGVPGWVAYAALGTSAFAVLVSTVAARVAYMSYRASGPRLRLEATHKETDASARRVVIDFTVTNLGRGDVSIEGFKITPYGHRRPVLDVTDVEGPSIPARLAGSSSTTWHANVLPVARLYDAALRSGKIKPRSSWPSQFYFTVSAGNGTHAHDRTHQFDARQLIADAFPAK
jgi:hypothetical protein